MAKTRKKVSKKKVITIVIISVVAFVILNFIGAAIGTSTSITHPKRVSYEDMRKELENDEVLGNYDFYDKEDYIVKGLDGYELHCTSVSTPETRGTGLYMIMTHGHNANKFAEVKFIDIYIDLGFSCIIYDVRGHGLNEKAICSMGLYEAQDLNYLIEDTFSRFGDVDILGLQGESMGTSTNLNALKYTDKVDFVVADCGFESLTYMLHDMYNDMHLPPFGFCAEVGFKLIYHIDPAEVSAIDALKGKNVPILFVHGEADDWIDVENSEDMYNEACKYAHSELWLVPEAKHVKCRKVAGKEAYQEHIVNFLEAAGIEISAEEYAEAA